MVVRVVHARVVDSATHQPRHPPSIHIAVGGEADIFPLHVLVHPWINPTEQQQIGRLASLSIIFCSTLMRVEYSGKKVRKYIMRKLGVP